jgi:methylphosphotriester-DNA--protein-cysteine methyltransferase
VKSQDRIEDMAENGLFLEDGDLTDPQMFAQEFLQRKSAKGIEAHILASSLRNTYSNTGIDIKAFQRRAELSPHNSQEHTRFMEQRQKLQKEGTSITQPLDKLKIELLGFNKKTTKYFDEKRY